MLTGSQLSKTYFDFSTDLQQLLVNKEGPSEQPECSPSLEQADPPAPPHVKEEQEEVRTEQEGEQLQGLQEADVIKLTFSPVTLKSEAEDEEKFQRSQDCGDPKPAQNPRGHSQPDTDSTKDSKSECNSKNQSLSGSKLGRRSRQISNPKTYTRSNTEEVFSCSFCRDTFAQQAHLTEHMELHTGGKQYSSILCGKSFTWPYQLNHHQHVGHQSSELPQHQTRGSKHANPLKTGGRSKPTRNINPASHDKTADSESETDDSCDWKETNGPQSGSANSQALLDMDCNPGKISVSSFNHEGDQGKQNVSQKPLKPLSCSVCSRKYSSKSSLRNHMRLHSEGKYFTCSVCKKKFPSRGELEKHMRIHTGEKPFKCSICDKAFIQNSSLTVHMRGHTGEKPFSCSLCEKSYAVKSTLRMHMRKHTGEKPYSCKVCGRSFVRGTILKTHKCQRKAATEMKLLS